MPDQPNLKPKNNVLELYTIYNKPLDHPDKFVVRRWAVEAGRIEPKEIIGMADTLTEARRFVPEGLSAAPRDKTDALSIVETWL